MAGLEPVVFARDSPGFATPVLGGRPIRPVVVFTPNLAGNATGRALVFVDLLSGHRPVALAGPRRGPMWKPLEGRAREMEVIDLGARGLRPSGDTRRLLASSTAILIKPLFSSFGQWLLAGRPGPAILDIDDPEMALMRTDFRTLARSLTSLDGPVVTSVLLRLVDRANAITVSNGTLQTQASMEVIPHARDEGLFEPSGVRSRAVARDKLGIPASTRLVVFVGTDRSHKGVDLLIGVAPDIAPARIIIVGAKRRPTAAHPNVTLVPPVPYAEAIRWLAAADVVVVPQLPGPVGRYQAPAKVVDAMAAGRAIVASDLPPIREMVGDDGLLVAPGSREALANGINSLLSDGSHRESLEQRVRRRFLERFSLASVRPALERVLQRVEG
jgi:glycosyltransferase involved in cell wall biosynthesis